MAEGNERDKGRDWDKTLQNPVLGDLIRLGVPCDLGF